MRIPIDNYEKTPKGYRQGDKTFYSDFHLGIDLMIPIGTPIYAPTNGTAKYSYGNEGGNTISFLDEKGRLHRFLHLATWSDKKEFKEGERIAYSGNSGSVSKGFGHLHWDLSKNGKLELNNRANFLNPEIIIKEILQTMNYENKIVRNSANGEYAFILNGKRRVITAARAGFAAITAIDRGLLKDDIISISETDYLKIPSGDNF